MTTKEKQAIGGAVLLFWAGLAAAKPTPTLRIDRRVWALEEDVFFWSGLSSEDELAPEDVEGCGVTITAPDGSTTQQPFYWPADGDPRHGWSGGTGVAASETVEGEYRVLASCGGEVVEGSFEVRRMDVLDEIDMRIEIEPGCGEDPDDETVSWVVENRSSFPLVVAAPGSLMLGGAGIRLERWDPPAACHVFVPPEALGVKPPGPGDVLIENLSWEDVGKLELVRVAPGEAHKRSFCLSVLADLCSIAWPPDYFAVSTSTQLLVGPRDGQWAGAGPFQLSASAERDLPPQTVPAAPAAEPSRSPK